jgi:hypothetical protein
LSDLVLRFTKHAKEKLGLRQIDLKTVEEVLSYPQHRFYDTLRGSEVVAKRVMFMGEAVTIVVIYTKGDDEYKIITVYPSKRFEEEAHKKVKSGRWLEIKGGGL